MARPAPRRLKVFQARLGFYDTVVAAPSQVAALRAWGVHQNLFANGQAALTDEPQAVEAALAHPETPLKRPVGSKDAFGLEARLPKAPAIPKSIKVGREPPAQRRSKQRADRSALDAAERGLSKLDEDRKGEEAAIQRRQDRLDAERVAAQAAYVENRKAATAAVGEARKAYRKAGGET
jgi:hypothetical protein